jgi:hypothetical protein
MIGESPDRYEAPRGRAFGEPLFASLAANELRASSLLIFGVDVCD